MYLLTLSGFFGLLFYYSVTHGLNVGLYWDLKSLLIVLFPTLTLSFASFNFKDIKIHLAALLIIGLPMSYFSWQFFVTEYIHYLSLTSLSYCFMVPGYIAFEYAYEKEKNKKISCLAFYLFGYSVFRIHHAIRWTFTALCKPI